MPGTDVQLTVDAAFPGGNVLVDSIDGEVVRLRQDRRTSSEWWFYWYFRVRGAAGRTVRFEFTDGDVFTAAGPCYSPDGAAWQWLGQEVISGNSFTFTFAPRQDEAYFSLGIPYVEKDLHQFLASRPAIDRKTFTLTEHGREAELLWTRSAHRRRVVALTARSHACEAMASYVLEGMLDFWLSDSTPAGRFLREEIDFVVFPFVDKDGVEAGDQGKLRSPHDHNRDFTDQPLYATTRGIQRELLAVADRVALGIDLHCPWIRGRRNEDFYIVGPRPPADASAKRLAMILEHSRQGEIPCPADQFLPFGVDWNTGTSAKLSDFIGKLPCAEVAVPVEIPYAVAGGVAMSTSRARDLGGDLARAVAIYFGARV